MKDSSGAILVKAQVTLTETSTGSNYNAVTNDQGLFNFPELPPGSYTISASEPSLSTYQQTGITVSVGDTAKVDIVLGIGSAHETVTVRSDASQLETKSSDVGIRHPQHRHACPCAWREIPPTDTRS